jgi:hypothetical protein
MKPGPQKLHELTSVEFRRGDQTAPDFNLRYSAFIDPLF